MRHHLLVTLSASLVLSCDAGIEKMPADSDPDPSDEGSGSDDPSDDPTEPGRVTLEITLIGGGTIDVEPSGTTCRDSCQLTFDAGTEVTLTPPTHTSAEPGDVVLARWNSTCDAVGPCALKLREDTDVEALFGVLRVDSVQISEPADDALQDPGGSPMLPSYGFVSLYTMSHIGAVRFALPIARGEPILDAAMNLFVDSDGEDNPDLGIYLEDSDDAAAFTTEPNNLSPETRPRTEDLARLIATETGEGYLASPSLESLLQTAVDREGWVAGNHVALLLQPLSGDNSFEFRQYDYDLDGASPGDFAAFLDITYVELADPDSK